MNLATASKKINIERYMLLASALCLLLGSVLYYKERITFSDTAWYITKIITEHTFSVSSYRFIAVITQLLPYLGNAMGLSLKAILILYSVNMMLLPVAGIFVSVFWFRETRTGWSILLFYILSSALLFYYPVTEFQMGLCVTLFYIGLFEHFNQKRIKPIVFWTLSILILPTIVFSHPLSLLALSGWLAWQIAVNSNTWKNSIAVACITGAAYVVKSIFFKIPYEDNKARGLDHFSNLSLADLDSTLVNSYLKYVRQDYFLLPLLLLAGIAGLLWMRKYIAAGCYIAIVSGCWVLVSVTFMNDPYNYYYEHMYQAVPFFTVIAFARYTMPLIPLVPRTIAMLLVIVISFTKIDSGKVLMRERLKWMDRVFALIDRKQSRKAILNADDINIGWDKFSFWATPYESLLYSSLRGPQYTKTIFPIVNMQDASWKAQMGRDNVFAEYHFSSNSQFPGQYFGLDNSPYLILDEVFSKDVLNSLNYGQ